MSASALSLWAHVQTATAAIPFRRALPRDASTVVRDIRIPEPEGGTLVVVAHFLPRPAPLVVVLHGVGGSSDDAYVVRAAHELVRAGFHVVRLNQRGSGRGAGRARRLYHAGLADDLALVEQFVRHHHGDVVTSIGALGFSLGGHVALHRAAAGDMLRAVVAISAPIDLSTTMDSFARMRRTPFEIYERLMTRSLVEKARALKLAFPDAPFTFDALKRITTIDAFDEVVTIACNGFASVAEYHREMSVGPRLASITTPTLLVHAEDDPVCPADVLRRWPVSSSIELAVLPAGGHVGFVADLSQLWGANAAVSRAIAFFKREL